MTDKEKIRKDVCSEGVKKSKQEEPVDIGTQIDYQNDAIKNLNSVLNSMEHNGHLPVIEEPVSKDLEEELSKVRDRESLDEYACQVSYDLSNVWAMETATWHIVETAVKLGAKWQKQKDNQIDKILEVNYAKGWDACKQQMMKDAIEQDVDSIWANPVNTLERLGLHNLKGKVKLIIIKQEEESVEE